jgi:hypothetical protein
MAVALALAAPGPSKDEARVAIPAGSKIYVEPMDGFGSFVITALQTRGVPVQVVATPEGADWGCTLDDD